MLVTGNCVAGDLNKMNPGQPTIHPWICLSEVIFYGLGSHGIHHLFNHYLREYVWNFFPSQIHFLAEN